MRQIITSILIILLFSQTIFSQEKITKYELDRKTYQLYLSGNWAEILNQGKKGLSQNIDFYYLRMRMGIAAYNLKDYRKAIKHFEKVIAEQPENQFIQEYLYYSYFFSGRTEDAKNYSAPFSKDLKEKLKIKSTLRIENIYSEFSYSYNSDLSSLKFNSATAIKQNTSSQNILKNNLYSHLGSKVSLSKKASVYLGYSFLNIKNYQEYSREFKLFEQPPQYNQWNFDNTTQQHEIYFNLNFLITKGLSITAAFHFLSIKAESYNMQWDTQTQKDVFTPEETTQDDWVTSLALNKNIGKFDLGLHASYSKLSSDNQYTGGTTLAFYPLGNLNFYSISDVTILKQKEESDKNYLIFSQKIGLKLFKYLWSEALVSFGDRKNYNQDNAFVVYNDLNTIKNQFGIDFIFPFTKFEFSLRYKYSQEEMSAYHTPLTPPEENSITTSTTENFNKHSITGGIKWKF